MERLLDQPLKPILPIRQTNRFCPHVTLVAIVTPTVWVALIYLLLVR